MSIRTLAAIAALALGLATAAAAEAATPAEIVAYCTSEGAFGQTFGTDFKGPGRFRPGWIGFTPAQPYPPFTDFGAGRTLHDRKVFGAEAVVTFRDKAEATAAVKALGAAIRESGRFPNEVENDETFLSFTERDAPEDAGRGLRIDLMQLGPELTFQCIDSRGQGLVMDEALGRGPPPKERPAPPTAALPAAVPPNACDTPESRKALVEDFRTRTTDFLGFGQELTRYSQVLMRWKADQLIKRGVWTDEDASNFGMDLLKDEAFMAMASQGMNDLLGMLEPLVAFDKAEKAKDEGAACKAAVASLAAQRRIGLNVSRQWKLIEDRYDAIARAKGIDLDKP